MERSAATSAARASRVRLRTLGRPAIELDGELVGAPGAAAIALLVVLGIERMTTRAMLTSLLWPELTPEAAAEELTRALFALREVVGEEWIRIEGERISVADALVVDAEEVRDAVRRGDATRAVSLWGGPFADGLVASPLFESWAAAHRARLERLYRRAEWDVRHGRRGSSARIERSGDRRAARVRRPGVAGFLTELKDRHVLRVAGIYCVVAWVVIQVATTILPPLHVSDFGVTLVIVLSLLGFPLAVAAAWAFDFTAEGYVRHADGALSTWGLSPHAWTVLRRGTALLAAGSLAAIGFYAAIRGNVVALPKSADPLAGPVAARVAVFAFTDDPARAERFEANLRRALDGVAEIETVGGTASLPIGADPVARASSLGAARAIVGSLANAGAGARAELALVDVATRDTVRSWSFDRDGSDPDRLVDRAAVDLAAYLARSARAAVPEN